ncbi:MAG: class I SAM-dependent methyltransferase [Acidimicrobiales bacterium]
MAHLRTTFPFNVPDKVARWSRYGLAKSRYQLVKMLPAQGVGAEIGVWKGDFSASLLRHTRPKQLHLIDPWIFQEDQPRAWYGGLAARSQADMDAISDAVRTRFAAEIAAGTVVVHRSPSTEALRLLADGGLDWIYVDGNHLYDAVMGDLTMALPKLRPGGLLACDDYGSPGWWDDGVRRAVDEFVAGGAVEAVADLGSQFVMRRPVP